MNRPRQVAAIVHRYTGLTIALFVAITGLTGAVIAWNDQLERVFAPSLFVLAPDAANRPALDAFTLREMAERESGYAVNALDWTRAPGAPAFMYLETRPGGPAPKDDEIALDPSTGKILGSRHHGDLSQGRINTMPFIYDVHDALALGDTGRLILGIAALLWTIDCFVGAYLTFPARAQRARSAPWWIKRWAPSWVVRRGVGRFKLFYDLHRVGGLWPWALLLIIAWSSVSFNLPQIYGPVTQFVLGAEVTPSAPAPANPLVPPRLGWREAHGRGQVLMADAARRERFTVRLERLMFYDPSTHVYAYRVFSDLDPGDAPDTGNTQIRYNGDTGQLIELSLPTGRKAGTTLTTWIGDIHVGAMLGLPLRIALTLVGLASATLSVTGVWLWWRKRRARVKHRKRPFLSRPNYLVRPHQL